MNMYLHELRTYRKSTIIWTFSLIGMVIVFMSMFSSFAKDAAIIENIFNNFPKEMRTALGLSSLDLSTLLGFYSFLFAYILLFGAIQAMNLGVSIGSVEVREKTADFLLAKPVTRKQIVTSKLLAALTCILITNIFYLITAFITLNLQTTASFNTKSFLLVSLSLFFIQIIFLTIGILISTIAKKIKSVLSVSLSTVFGFYILNLFSSAIGDEKIRYITPFKYFDTAYILENNAYELKFIILSIIIVIAATTVSYVLYSKKDINAF